MDSKTKVLLFDVDDVITSDLKEIGDDMKIILSKIPCTIGFISGTDLNELRRMITSKLDREHHLMANTGTHYVLIKDGQETEILNEILSFEEKKEIIDALKKLKEKYNLTPLTSEEDQIQDRNSQISFSILGRHASPEKKRSYDPNKEKRKEFVEYLKTILDENKYQINIGGTTTIDITFNGKDKGTGVQKFMEKNNLKKENIIFFGDQLSPGGNDYPVRGTGVKCIEVENPSETLKILKSLLEK